jgi:hypothetical protein
MKPGWLDAFGVDEDGGPAPVLPSEDASRFASAIVDRALPAASSGGAGSGAVRRAKASFVVSGAAGVLTVFAVAYGVWPKSNPAPITPITPLVVVPASAIPTPAAPPTETVTVAELPDAVATPPSSAASIATPIVTPHVASTHASPPLATPSDMLAAANRARHEQKWSHAAWLYRRVVDARTDESYPATIALASLRLEHFDDPEGALALYQRALASRPNGVLTAQAQAGVLRCRQALGQAPNAQ